MRIEEGKAAAPDETATRVVTRRVSTAHVNLDVARPVGVTLEVEPSIVPLAIADIGLQLKTTFHVDVLILDSFPRSPRLEWDK